MGHDESRCRQELGLKRLDGIIKGDRGRAPCASQDSTQTAGVFAHAAVDGRLILVPPQVGLELVDAAQHGHVHDPAELLGRGRQVHDRAINDRIEQARHGVAVLGLCDGAEKFCMPENPRSAGIGHRGVEAGDLHFPHKAEEVTVADDMVDHHLFQNGMPGRADSVGLRPCADASGKVLRQNVPDRLVEMTAR